MAMTRTEWNKRQAKLPPADRTSYEEYLSYESPAPTGTAPTTTPQQQAALLAQVVAASIIKTSVVTNTTKGEAPKRTEVEDIARAISATVGPVIAPNLPPAVVTSVVEQTTQAIVTNKDVKASDTGQSVTPAVVDKIVETAAGEGGTFGAIALERQREKDLQEALDAAKEAKTTTPMSKEEWNRRQAKLPAADRTPYEEYLKDFGPKGSTGSTGSTSSTQTGGTPDAAYDRNNNLVTTPTTTTTTTQTGGTPDAAYDRKIESETTSPTETTDPIKGPGDFRKFDETGTGFTGPTGPTPTLTGPTGDTATSTATFTGATYTEPTYTDPTFTSTTSTGPTGATATLTGPTGTGTTGTGATGPVTYTASDGTVFTDQQAYVDYQKILNDKRLADDATSAANAANRQSAYDLLYAEFSRYGLGSLVEPLRGLIQSGASPSEFALKLRESDPYKKRFAGNQQRISKGLKAISEAEYIGLEDQYQSILRNAGLPESYWKQSVDPTTGIVSQEGFTNFIGNDVSPVELEDRVLTAQQRLIYANPEVSIALKTFYPDITNGDLLAYALDPTKGLEQIKRRITAAEVGSSAVQMGLATNVTDAEYLARYGVNKAQAQQGYRTAAEILPTASKLGDIYSRQGLGAYTQQTAEQEIFNVPGAADAAAKRRKLSELEQASFSGRSGMGALARERAGSF